MDSPDIVEVILEGTSTVVEVEVPGIQGPAGPGSSPVANNTILGNISGATAQPVGLAKASVKTLLGFVEDADMQAALTPYAQLVSPSFTTPNIGDATGASLVLSGLLDLRKVSAANIIQYATNGYLRTDTSQLTIYNAGLNRNSVSLARGEAMVFSTGASVAFADSANADGGVVDTRVSRQSAGVVQVGTTANNALGTLSCNQINIGTSGLDPVLAKSANAGTFRSGLNGFSQTYAAIGYYGAGAVPGLSTTSNGAIAWSSSTTDAEAGKVLHLSRNSDGVLQVGTTAANALGTLRAESLVANNNLNCYQVIVGSGGGARLRDGSGDLEILNNAGSARSGVRALSADITNGVTCANVTASGTVRLGSYTVATLPIAAANTRARAFVTDSNLAFNSTNLGSTVTAGGSTLVPVFSNGTNWVIG